MVLSAQCTDKQVNKVTSKLFQIIKNPEDILILWEEKLKQIIKSIGFYNTKARNIYKLSWQLTNDIYKWIIPSSLELLMGLAGVGEKTAKVVSHQLYWANYIAVDTHVHRVCNRLNRVHTKTAELTSKIIEWRIYAKNLYLAHHALILFGRYLCKARKPECERCPLKNNCNYFKINNQFTL